MNDMSRNNMSMGEEEYDLNRSYNSVLSGTSTANASTSSKAVLAALRALQDKIRRLEAERTQALDETSHLKHQLQTQSIEAEHSRQKENLAVQKNLQEARSAYDKMLSEKSELENRAIKMEEKNKMALAQADEMQTKIRFLEEEKHSTALRLKDLEHQHQQLESQIRNTEHKERDLAQSIVWETKRHEEEVTTLRRRVESLQDELEEISASKRVTDAKITELDQLVGELLSVNQQLVNQLSGHKTSKGASSPAKVAKKVKKVNKSTTAAKATIRAASQTTASFEANKTTKYSTRKPSQLIAVQTEEIEQLKNMHKKYADLAKELKKGGKKTTTKKKAASTKTEGMMRSVNTDADAPKRRTRSASPQVTRLSRKKAELQEKYAEDAANYSVNYSMRSSSPQSFSLNRNGSSGGSRNSMDVHLPQPSSSFVEAAGADDSELLDLDGSGIAGMAFQNDGSLYGRYYREGNGVASSKESVNIGGRRAAETSNSFDDHHHRSTSASTAREAREARGELQSVISSLEEEFDQLNMQYRHLLSNVASKGGDGEKQTAEEDATQAEVDFMQSQAEEIVSVIQKLQKKGDQLRTLRNSPANSPQR